MRKHLPHRPFGLNPTHVTIRLAGSIPQAVLQAMRSDRERRIEEIFRQTKEMVEDDRDTFLEQQLEQVDDLYEQSLETALHEHSNGPYYLQKPAIAQEVLKSCQWLEANRDLKLYAICVMGNHVHVLWGSKSGESLPSGPIMKSWKNFTALQCNRMLDRTGQNFWSVGYFDRDVRPNKFFTVLRYILNNPVKAGLVRRWFDWPHTYLSEELVGFFRE